MNESSVRKLLSDADFTIGNAELNVIDTDEKINAKIRDLNVKQREIFDFVHKSAKNHQKPQPSRVKKEIKSF